MADFTAAETARERAVQEGTHADHARSWSRWTDYCSSIGLRNDLFLESLDREQGTYILGAFGVAIREGRFSTRKNAATLASLSVTSTISHVAAAFKRNGLKNPTHDDEGNLAWILARQYRAYKNDDPKEIPEKAIPLCVISLVALKTSTKKQLATTQLLKIGAFFFAMRSCEYLQVPKQDDKKTKQLTLSNIAFYKDGNLIAHSSTNLSKAASVSVTFESQKNSRKFDTITQWRTTHETLCPVKQWASLVQRIWAYPNATAQTLVSAVLQHKKITHITNNNITNALQDSLKTYGEACLQINIDEIGTHSIRSGAAMAIYLGGAPVFAIQMIGRWSSNSFMKYIRKQIEEFTYGISQQMLTMQDFRHIPNNAPTSSPRQTEYGGSASLMLLANNAESGGTSSSQPPGTGRGETIY